MEISCRGSYILDPSVNISAFIHQLCKWAHLYCWQFNQLVTNGLSHPYHLDESTFILGAAGVTFHFYFAFYYIYIGNGTARFITVETRMFPDCAGIAPTPSRWRHGCFRRLPGLTGIWQPSRLLPVSPGCFKHFKTTGDMSRFNTVHSGSPRLSTVPPRLWHGSSRFIPDHQTGMNRHLKPGQWERGFKVRPQIRYAMLCTAYHVFLSDNFKFRFFFQNNK